MTQLRTRSEELESSLLKETARANKLEETVSNISVLKSQCDNEIVRLSSAVVDCEEKILELKSSLNYSQLEYEANLSKLCREKNCTENSVENVFNIIREVEQRLLEEEEESDKLRKALEEKDREYRMNLSSMSERMAVVREHERELLISKISQWKSDVDLLQSIYDSKQREFELNLSQISEQNHHHQQQQIYHSSHFPLNTTKPLFTPESDYRQRSDYASTRQLFSHRDEVSEMTPRQRFEAEVNRLKSLCSGIKSPATHSSPEFISELGIFPYQSFSPSEFDALATLFAERDDECLVATTALARMLADAKELEGLNDAVERRIADLNLELDIKKMEVESLNGLLQAQNDEYRFLLNDAEYRDLLSKSSPSENDALLDAVRNKLSDPYSPEKQRLERIKRREKEMQSQESDALSPAKLDFRSAQSTPQPESSTNYAQTSPSPSDSYSDSRRKELEELQLLAQNLQTEVDNIAEANGVLLSRGVSGASVNPHAIILTGTATAVATQANSPRDFAFGPNRRPSHSPSSNGIGGKEDMSSFISPIASIGGSDGELTCHFMDSAVNSLKVTDFDMERAEADRRIDAAGNVDFKLS
jgi:hypothetical protein